MFLRMGSSVQWITTTLQTTETETIRGIIIYPFDSLPETIEEAVCQEWRDLDRLLVEFGTSRSIRPQVAYVAREGGMDRRDRVSSLLPELTRRGLIYLVEAAC